MILEDGQMSRTIPISPGIFIRTHKGGPGPWHKVRDIGGRAPELSALTRCGRIFFYDEVTETSAVLPTAERVCLPCSHGG
jgi:hypothetical protein